MYYTVRFIREAYTDIYQSIAWYSKKGEVAERFLQAIRKQIKLIKSNPRLYPPKYTHQGVIVRSSPLKKFPFVILYTFDEMQYCITVFALWHTAQDPLKWQKRIET